MWTLIRLLKEQFDLDLHCLPFCLHLSGRLLNGKATFLALWLGPQGELIVYQWSIVVVRPSVVVHTFKFEYLSSQVANLDQILYVASLGWGKGCIRFWGRLDEYSGFHGNRKPSLTYNGENNVSSFSRLFFYLILFILAGKEDMHKISDKFEFWPDRATDYGVSCPWASKTFPIYL